MGQFFSFFVHGVSPWPARASQVCAISQCQHLSVRLIQLRLRQLQRVRVTGVSLTGFVFFVFFSSSYCFACHIRTVKDKLPVPQHAPFEKATMAHLFEVLSKYILLADRLWHDRCPQHVCVCPYPLIGHISAFIGQRGTGLR